MKKTITMLSLAAIAGSPAIAADVAKINWSKIPATTLTLFYPGKSSYEWLISEEHKGAVKEVKRGDACTTCHDEPDGEKDLGDKLVKGGRLESDPVAAKNGHVDLKVQAAYDDKNAYMRFQWKTQGGPSEEYEYYRFDGKDWKVWGGPRLDKPVQDGKQPAIYEARMSIMLDDGKVPMFAEQGCWLTCHEGERDLNPAKKEEVAANEAMKAYKKADVRKYLPASRNDPSDWRTGKTLEEIAKIKADGGFVDLIQWRAHRTNPVGGMDDGYVLEWRNFDDGKNHFASNQDRDTKLPKFMFDVGKFGAKAVVANQVNRQANFLIKGVNAVPFDPNAGWKEGDMLPRYVLSAADATGSAADNKGTGVWKDGMWTVVITRPLGLTNADDKALKPGGVYNVGLAVHDDNITTRGHFVSWTKTLGLGAKKADIKAVKLK